MRTVWRTRGRWKEGGEDAAESWNMMWESETCFLLLRDERLKKTTTDRSFSIQMHLCARVWFCVRVLCVCWCVCAASVYPGAKCVRVGKCWLITWCSFENRGAFILSGERHRAKCQTLEINSLVMTTLDGENNTGEKVREGKGVVDVVGWKWRRMERWEKEEGGRWKHFPFFALPSESGCQSLLPKLLNLSLFSLFFFHLRIVSFSLNLFIFFTHTTKKPPGVSLWLLNNPHIISGSLLYLLICLTDLLTMLCRRAVTILG